MEFRKWARTQWDRGLALACVLAAAVVMLVGWVRISDTPYPAEQLPIILSGGIGAVILVGIGATLWLSADLRDEWRKLDAIDDSLRDLKATPLRLDEVAPPADGQATNGSTAAVVRVPAAVTSPVGNGESPVDDSKRRMRRPRSSR